MTTMAYLHIVEALIQKYALINSECFPGMVCEAQGLDHDPLKLPWKPVGGHCRPYSRQWVHMGQQKTQWCDRGSLLWLQMLQVMWSISRGRNEWEQLSGTVHNLFDRKGLHQVQELVLYLTKTFLQLQLIYSACEIFNITTDNYNKRLVSSSDCWETLHTQHITHHQLSHSLQNWLKVRSVSHQWGSSMIKTLWPF